MNLPSYRPELNFVKDKAKAQIILIVLLSILTRYFQKIACLNHIVINSRAPNLFKRKQTHIAMKQRYENARIVRGSNGSGILGGTDSFTVIGISGLGKSAAICKAVELLEGNCVVELESPYTKIIPCLTVQCPFDSSVKGLLFEILRKVDETLNSRYYENAVRARATTDMLIGSVSQVALNHIGVLIVDEIQNVAENKNGRNMVGMLTLIL